MENDEDICHSRLRETIKTKAIVKAKTMYTIYVQYMNSKVLMTYSNRG